MSLGSEMSAADIAAVTGGNGGLGGWGGDGSFIIILFLFAMMSGWGGGFGGGYGGNQLGYDFPWLLNANDQTDALVTAGFNNAAITGQLSGIQSSITNGFSNAEVAACNRAMTDQATMYNNQIASMNQNFTNQMALSNQLNGIQSEIASCCCAQSQNAADLKYVIATENCADRAAINDALRDVLEANNAGVQRILDTMCQDRIDAKNEKISELQNQLTMAQLAASQNAQTAAIVANNEAQTTALERYLAPQATPAYIVPNPNCCAQNYGYSCAA